MRWNFAAGLLAVFTMDMHAPPPADACGVKLTVKSSAPRKAVARTSNPSDVLLLGSPPRRLELNLAAAGHRVEVAPNAAAAKRKSYAVVIVDPPQQEEARSSFDGAVVLVRSGDVVADVRSVEKQVARKPLRAGGESRTALTARTERTPIDAGPRQDPERRIVATSEPKERTPPPEPTPPPERVTTVPRPVAEVKPPEVTPTAEPRPKAPVARGPNEVYFAYNRFGLAQANATLARTVRWLKGSDVSVIIEGHADPAGNPEDNMKLAQRRAELVRDHLVSAGIDASRLEVISYGDTRLKYGRTDPRNRRVTIIAK